MASDIVPIQLSLTEGDLVTLWAPRWREDGEEWEAFLGDDDALFAFPSVPRLAAFVRTATEHDLIDHPAWSVVPDLTVSELTPDDTQRYDIVGVPELAASEPDTWTIGELAEITDMVRSIADVCELERVTAVLDAAPAFGLLSQGTLPFVGREGKRLWTQLMDTIAERWDEVVDSLDELVEAPEVDAAALAAAEKEVEVADDVDAETEVETDVDAGEETDEPAEERPRTFWEEVGIDPVRIISRDGEVLTLRCYLNDSPVFLGTDGRIDVVRGERALTRWIAEDGADGHDLVEASTWPEIVDKATVGDLEVIVDELNVYDLTGLEDDIAEGTLTIDATQLEQATELLLDVGDWADDEEPREALAESQPLGWLVSFVVRPDPTRLAPSPPFHAEAARFRELIDHLLERLQQH
ncbi:primosomal protein [Pseudonocardia humida]|uniref:Primosomal protein n=1 Tax=Pseudonocardia humida TaxID=2800819 RepID=A0ABT0ZVY6_9PSEU|nr:primosomal protein [Pseudonocardia humida]MCO1654814.1 primosomal protein [Pseudonocardia humida]